MGMNNAYLTSFFNGLNPAPLLTVSQWADKYRVLPSKSSAEPGRWRTSRTPYLREIQDELSPHVPTQEVKVIKATQLGFTELGNNVKLCYMHLYPCPMLMVMPTESLARKHSTAKLTPSMKLIPELMAKVKDAKSKDDAGGTLEKDFEGGMLSIGWSGSPSTFASFSARLVDADDVERFAENVGDEGSSLQTIRKRTDAFPNRKIYINSTPKLKNGPIDREYKDSDQRLYHMPCPRCGELVIYEFEQFKFEWDQERYELTSDVHFECPHCKEAVQEFEKTWMMNEENGAKWIPQNPGHRHRGYKINSFYSPLGWVSWVEIIHEWIKSKKALDSSDNELMKVFFNTRLGEPWEESHDSTNAEDILLLKNSFAPGIVPNDTAALVMAVDVQQDHFWFKVQALRYGAGKHTIRYGRAETWAALEDILYTQYKDLENNVYMIALCAVDSGFKRDEVYEFCAMNSDICIPIKGASGKPSSPWRVTPVEKDINGVTITTGLKLYLLDTEYFKDMLHSQLERSILCAKEGDSAKDNLFSTHSETDLGYAKQMTSEYKNCEINEKTGVEKWTWQKVTTKADNHLWDCGAYCTFLGELLGVRFLQKQPIETPRKAQRRESNDDFMSNY